MQQTEHYQLNQWEREDRIQMADFNSDNQKIEAALTAQAAELDTKTSHAELAAAIPWVKITEVTTTKAAESAGVTIQNPGQYRELRVFVDCSGGFRCSLKWNGVSIVGLPGANRDYLADRIIGVLEIIPLKTEGSAIRYSFGVNTGGYGNSSDALFSQACICTGPVTLSVASSSGEYPLNAGASFVVYGLKV
ncbi:hypothetical protein [uncultured Dysosmobacter sp.]|uniref:hypothetical protein n=1 Tax=uncultured Dysosmobacter sp. TaxID=2591384 RepID=UPI002628C515|nr:hypothetical protein [uncultured Dysosmobacter sp.]